MKKAYIFLLLSCVTHILFAHRSKLITPYYSMRSQGLSSARELIGVVDFINLPDQCDLYGVSAITVEYSRSWNPQLMANCLFGKDLCHECESERIVISGSSIENRSSQRDWLADYFGLPTDFLSHVFFKPRVENTIVDCQLYVGLNNWYPGLYFESHLPFVYTKRTVGIEEKVLSAGENDYLAGYFAPTVVERSRLLNNFTEFALGCATADLPDNITFEQLQFAKMTGDRLITKKGIAEIEAALGWNFLLDPDYHLGVNFRIGIPAGTRPDGVFLFEPIVGNGHHWIVGGGLSMHVKLWEDECSGNFFNAYVDAHIYDMITTTQTRFFDIKGKNNSRYMLAQRFDLPITNQLRGRPGEIDPFEVPDVQFKNVYAPVANLTTFEVKVHGGYQVDVTVMGHFKRNCLAFDFGYNFWYRSCERVDIDPDCLPPKLVQKNWVLKGDAHMFGFNITDDTPVALSASQSDADIHTGLNFGPGKNPALGIVNGGVKPILGVPIEFTIDKPQAAFSEDDKLVGQPGGMAQTNTSIPPRFIRPSSLDICSSSTESTIHALFINLNYEGNPWCNLIPFIGIGGKISGAFQDDNPFKQVNVSRCETACSESQCISCRPCLNECLGCGISEWALWIKGGIAF